MKVWQEQNKCQSWLNNCLLANAFPVIVQSSAPTHSRTVKLWFSPHIKHLHGAKLRYWPCDECRGFYSFVKNQIHVSKSVRNGLNSVSCNTKLNCKHVEKGQNVLTLILKTYGILGNDFYVIITVLLIIFYSFLLGSSYVILFFTFQFVEYYL